MGMPHAAEKWTAAKVRVLPEDGQRHELIDGTHIVTPAPRGVHQVVLRELFTALHAVLGKADGIELLWSPADISLGEDEILQPDLFVCRTRGGVALRDWHEVEALLLVIEVLSPSTAPYDRGLKRRRYQRAGVPEYWVVDIDARAIERWRPDDTSPEIVTGILRFTLEESRPESALDVAAVFAKAAL
jgi:Uma2 family endonuclease